MRSSSKPAKELLRLLLDPGNGLGLDVADPQEENHRTLRVLIALRHAGFAVSAAVWKMPMYRLKGPSPMGYRASSGVHGLLLPGCKTPMGLDGPQVLASQLNQWHAKQAQTHREFRLGTPGWETVWPAEQPLSELRQELLPLWDEAMSRTLALVDQWMLQHAVAPTTAPRRQARL